MLSASANILFALRIAADEAHQNDVNPGRCRPGFPPVQFQRALLPD